ncbi:MAG: hypothetical protein EOQ40_17460 [Mesorhizobium sp.]|uniref:DUF6602 domain-containing protein n=1 Tax=Mesorhizobium sp. TaxID=1871066 RepID=UPI000FE80285|nr:DUF6602 domain-containing protein [Mesorhizobium sp.]RWB19920.1 MAG: hypothetical protein EOQ40_17460 [Mesorhizobium sp.]
MITSFAEFLEQLQEKEAAILAGQSVTHGPTIGDMYEGLTRELLERAIPEQLNVRLVDGFVLGVDGKLSHQTDAMLVMGDKGERIPKTDQWIWPIEDVLAVFEVKKSLFGNQLVDSIEKMRIVSLQQKELMASERKRVKLGPSKEAFARLMGRFPSVGELEDFQGAGGEILRTIAHEQLAPVRIVFGYEGYADETGLRKGFLDALRDAPGGIAGPAVLPNLIVCRKNAILKMNGHPFVSPVGDDGRWNLFGSTRAAPFALLLELIWTRLGNEFNAQFPIDDSLTKEVIAPLLAGEVVTDGSVRGWMFHYSMLSKKQLADTPADQWEPFAVTLEEYVIFGMAMNGGGLDLNDQSLQEGAAQSGLNLKAFADRLVAARLFSWVAPDVAHPVNDTIHTSVTPDGNFWLSDNQKLLGLWSQQYVPKPKR